ncbi:response regulator [Bradyrhizobium stylosanthis]|uniref:CheY-like chemotaxis protein n=1 Tax=Bradyrhizobium stylosanthis TaxID=1803665 RepID=A0A560D632_9BRAD|nr:response regulator [Bradyrhizobium stylosanthis]TWA92569.1 CheY-like chemotaxis protein [Bradyrhizobium stylosanthis]
MASVYLVEDEALIRMMVADMVTDLGHTVAAEAGVLPSALQFANNAAFDMAGRDVMLGTESSEPVARAIAERNIPFAFATGSGPRACRKTFRDGPPSKTISIEELERCFAELSMPGRGTDQGAQRY